MAASLRKRFATRSDQAGFALRTTLAALLGLILAALLDIRHPWWAAMTVWLVAQPTRGLFLERAVARLVGTVVGAGAGVAMLVALGGHRIATLGALIAWVGLCAAGGSLFRHFRTYAFVLSGYSAAIVVLFALGDGSGHGGVAVDRISCTILGILCSTIVAVGISPRRAGETLRQQFDTIVAQVLDRVETRLACRPGAAPQPILTTLAMLHRDMDDLAAGSWRDRRTAGRVRRTAGPLVELLALSGGDGPTTAAVGRGAGTGRIDALRLRAAREGHRRIAAVLEELAALLAGRPVHRNRRAHLAGLSPGRILRSALRPMVALAAASAVWTVTGWGDGAMMAVAATLFASLFSSHVEGNRALLHALGGSFAGAVAGGCYRLYVLPGADGVFAVSLALVPILLAGAWLMRQPGATKAAIDFNMGFLLTAQPMTPPPSMAATLGVCAAILCGILLAVGTYWLVLPSDRTVIAHHLRRRALRQALALRRATDGPRIERHRLALRAAILRQLELDPYHLPRWFHTLGQDSPTLPRSSALPCHRA